MRQAKIFRIKNRGGWKQKTAQRTLSPVFRDKRRVLALADKLVARTLRLRNQCVFNQASALLLNRTLKKIQE